MCVADICSTPKPRHVLAPPTAPADLAPLAPPPIPVAEADPMPDVAHALVSGLSSDVRERWRSMIGELIRHYCIQDRRITRDEGIQLLDQYTRLEPTFISTL